MTDQTTKKREKPLWRRILRKVILTLVAVVVIAIISMSIFGYITANQLREEIHKISAAGYPVTTREYWGRLPKIDQENDASRYYDAGVLLIRTRALGIYPARCRKALESIPAGELDERTIEGVEWNLSTNRLALEMFDTGAARPECRSSALNIHISPLHPWRFREAGALLSLRTLHLIYEGKGDAAAASLISLLRFTRILDRCPTKQLFLKVKLRLIRTAHKDARLLVEHTRPSEKALIELQETLDASLSGDLTRVIVADYVCKLARRRKVEEDIDRLPFIRTFLRWHHLYYLRRISKCLAAAREPWPEKFEKIAAASRCSRVLREFELCFDLLFDEVALLLHRYLAVTRSTMVAMMIERYRRAHGKLPTTLDELSPDYCDALPLDPFTGKNLVYRRGEDNYVVYSLGENLEDDEGHFAPDIDRGSILPSDWGIQVRIRSTDSAR